MKNNRKTVTRQIRRPLLIFFIILTVLAMIAIFLFSVQQILVERWNKGDQVATYTVLEMTHYNAIEWLVSYWADHYDKMNLIYDDTIMKENEEYLMKNIPGCTNLKYLSDEEIKGLPDDIQLKYAEWCYTAIALNFDMIKNTFKPSSVDAFTIIDDKFFYLVSGCGWGEMRISEGGEIYEPGITKPYEKGVFPVLDKIIESELPDLDLEVSFWDEDDQNNIRKYEPVYNEYGHLVMIIGISQRWDDVIYDTIKNTFIIVLLIIILFVVLELRIVSLVKKIVVRPIEKEKEVILDYISDKDPEKAIKVLSEIKTDNEIQTLAENFSFMASEIDEYVKQIRDVTSEKERLGAELDMAAKIQSSQLPRSFPAFPDRNEFDIFASMKPAKEVGGDFYDFFLIDEDHLEIIIADVSGKGVPAALFMMASKMLIEDYSVYHKQPSLILEDVNKRICENNSDDMFVTVWLGILEISTGRLTCSNAGHEYPVIKKVNKSFEIINDKHDLFIGTIPGIKYHDYEIQLEPGDMLFLYTDGVPEATRADLELFGKDRMVRALNESRNGTLKELFMDMKKAVDDFIGDAPQFDDLTMLAVRYLGNN